MGLRIATNIAALNAQRFIGTSLRGVEKTSAQLASGNRINKSADDPAGLAISENMRAQIRSAAQAKRNANDGISLAQTAEGSLGEISNIMTRIRELAIQASSDTIGENERQLTNVEVQQLKQEIERTAQSTSWNTTKLLNGTTPLLDFQIGMYSSENDVIQFDTSKNNATLESLGLTDVDFDSKEGARNTLSLIDTAQNNINGMRASLGAFQSRLTSTVEILAITEENLAAANSRIRDTDVAVASSEQARNQVLMQAGVATVAQANQTSQLALKLLS